MKYEVRSKESGEWSAWRDWYSGGGCISRAADVVFGLTSSGRITFQRTGDKTQLRVKK